jgi:excisionase family DNA binding protein
VIRKRELLALDKGDTVAPVTAHGDTGSDAMARETLSVKDARALLGISRGLIYAGIADGTIPSIRVGRRILIPKTKLLNLLGITASTDASTGAVSTTSGSQVSPHAAVPARGNIQQADGRLGSHTADLYDEGPVAAGPSVRTSSDSEPAAHDEA